MCIECAISACYSTPASVSGADLLVASSDIQCVRPESDQLLDGDGGRSGGGRGERKGKAW